jgi:hypothetical protein
MAQWSLPDITQPPNPNRTRALQHPPLAQGGVVWAFVVLCGWARNG